MHKVTIAGLELDLDCFVGTVTQVSSHHCELTDDNDNVKIFNIDKFNMPLPRLGDSVQITTSAGLPAIFSNFSSEMQYIDKEALAKKFVRRYLFIAFGGMAAYFIVGAMLAGANGIFWALMLAFLQILVVGIPFRLKLKRLEKEMWTIPKKIRQVVYPNN